MAFYEPDNTPTWPGASGTQSTGRQASWEHQVPPARSAAISPAHSQFSGAADAHAFAAQFEEIERATDNLLKSGKWFPRQQQHHHRQLQIGAAMGMSGFGGVGGSMQQQQRRADVSSAAAMGRGLEFGGGSSNDARGFSMGGGAASSQHQQQRHHLHQHQHQAQHQHASMGPEFDGRPGSSGLHGFYQGQRFPGPGAGGAGASGGRGQQSEAEQMLQAKRRMAAQRERELRNYHQEQQYHRTVSGGKSDRSMSPNTQQQTDENHRELITRQHRALYGENSSLYGSGQETGAAGSSNATSRASSQDVRVHSGGRGPSPLSYGPYGITAPQAGQTATADGISGMAVDGGASSSSAITSPTSAQQATFSPLVDSSSQQSQVSRTSNSSPGTSPPLGQSAKGGVAPIGTRPAAAAAAAANKRSTTPLTPSALSHGISADNKDVLERSTSSAAAVSGSNNAPLSATASATEKSVPGLGAWGSAGSAGSVWGAAAAAGAKNTLAVQPSVWG